MHARLKISRHLHKPHSDASFAVIVECTAVFVKVPVDVRGDRVMRPRVDEQKTESRDPLRCGGGRRANGVWPSAFSDANRIGLCGKVPFSIVSGGVVDDRLPSVVLAS